MKKILFIILFIFQLNTTLSQDYKNNYKSENLVLHIASCIPLETQLYMLKNFILQHYGGLFKYYDEFRKGNYDLQRFYTDLW